MKKTEDKNTQFNKYYEDLSKALKELNPIQVENSLKILRYAKTNENQVYLIGNGGSASTAEHWANDLLKIGRIKSISLTNLAIITALANDIGYDSIFIEQLKLYLGKEDVLIGITGSGNSKNIVKALEYAYNQGRKTIGILGFDGGKAKNFCTSYVKINSRDYGIIEDIHLSLGHYLARRLGENNLLQKKKRLNMPIS